MFTDELSKDSPEHAGPQTRFGNRRAAGDPQCDSGSLKRVVAPVRSGGADPGPTFGLRLSPAA